MPILDFNDVPEQRDVTALIPDGTFVMLKGSIRPDGATAPGFEGSADEGLFKKSASSDAMMLDWEFTVLGGEYDRKKLWQYFVITGGSVDEKGQSKAGNISKASLRAMLDSALGLDPKDLSEVARAKRMMPAMKNFDGIEFAARIGIEPGGPRGDGTYYRDKNVLAHVVVPGEPEWLPVRQGQPVPAKPSGGSSAPRPAAPAAAKPAWQQNAAPAAAPAAATPAWGSSNGSGAAPAAAPSATPAGAAGGPAWLQGNR